MPVSRVGHQGRRRRAGLPLAALGLEPEHRRGQAGHGRRAEEGREREGQTVGRAQPEDQAGGRQRMAAEGEEAGLDPHPLDAQHLGPQRGDLLLHGGARRHPAVPALRRRAGGRRQGPAVHLAVGRERHGVERDEDRGHHVVRELAAEPLAQLARRGGRGLRGHEVGGQTLVPLRVAPGHHHGLPDPRMIGQDGLDLAELDAEAAHLHLEVDAAEELDVAVRQMANPVPRAVEPLPGPGGERIRYEPLGGQRRPVEVAAREPHAADVQLAGHAGGDRQAVLQHVDPEVRDGPPDGRRGQAAVAAAGPRGDVDRRLRGAVEVVQLDAPQTLAEAAGERLRQGLAAADHPPEAGAATLGLGVLQEHLEHGGHEVQRGDAAAGDGVHQVSGILMAARPRHHQLRSGQQRPEELPDRDVEAERGLLQHPVSRLQAVGLLHPEQPVADPRVRDHGPLRQARRARGVDDVGEALGHRARGERPVAVAGDPLPVSIDEHPAAAGLPQRARQALLGQHHGDAAVPQHEGHALGRVLQIDGHVGRARLQDGQQADHHLQGALHGDADPRVRPDPQLAQAAGQAVRPAVQLPVGQRPLLAGDGHRVRRALHPRRDQLVQAAPGLQVVSLGVVPPGDHLEPLRLAQHR